MSQNEKARPAVGAAERAGREGHWASGNSHNHFTTRDGPISRLLLEGKENGLHLRDLVRLTGWSEREVRQQIHRERRRHIPILSDCKNGYFLPGSPQEREHCVRSMYHRASEILAAARAIEGEEIIEGQVYLDV